MRSQSNFNTLCENNKFNFGSFSYFRNAIYGFAALWIVVFHGVLLANIKAEFDPSIYLIRDSIDMGNIGVDVFVFLSGICLYFSYSKKPKLGQFYYKRFVRVYIPYLIMALPYIIYFFVVGQMDVSLMIRTILTINTWTGEIDQVDLWYISAILVFYLLYPLIYHFIFRNNPKGKMTQEKAEFTRMIILTCISIIISVIVYYCFIDAYNVTSRMLSRLTVFIIGTYVGKLVKQKKSFHEAFLIASILILAGAYPLYEKSVIPGLMYDGRFIQSIWSRYYGSLTGIALVFLLSQLFILLAEFKIDQFFAFFGTFSLEIYVLSIIGRRIFYYTPWYAEDGYSFLRYMIVMVFTIFVAWLVSKLEQPIFKLLLRKKSK